MVLSKPNGSTKFRVLLRMHLAKSLADSSTAAEQKDVAAALQERGFSREAAEKIAARQCSLEQVLATLQALETKFGLSREEIQQLAADSSSLFKIDAVARLDAVAECIQNAGVSMEQFCRELVRRRSRWPFTLSETSFRESLQRIQMLLPVYRRFNIRQKSFFWRGSLSAVQIEATIQFLVDLAGEHGAGKIILRNPKVLKMDIEIDLKPCIERYLAFGLTQKQLVPVICSFPRLLNSSEGSFQAKLAFFTELGFSHRELVRLFAVCPRVSSRSEKHCRRKIEYLRDHCGIGMDQIRTVLKRSPALLGTSIEKQLKPKVDYLASANITGEGLGRIFLHHSDVLLKSIETLESRINRFPKLRLSREQYIGLIKKRPSILNYGDEVLQKRIAFFRDFGKIPVAALAKRSAYFTYSLENRVKPRMKFLAWLHLSGYLVKARPFSSVLSLKEVDFRERYVKPCAGAGVAAYERFRSARQESTSPRLYERI